MIRKIFLVDALVDGPFSGAQTSVVFLQSPLDRFKMLSLAHEFAAWQTVYSLPHGKAHLLRFFSHAHHELPLGVHGAHAAAHLIFELGLFPPVQELRLLTQEGELTAVLTPSGALAVNVPAQNLAKMDSGRLALFSDLLALKPSDVAWGGITPARVAVLGLSSAASLRQLEPDRVGLIKSGAAGLAVTAPGQAGFDYGLRCFNPGHLHPEQEVSGNVQRSLAPHWGRLLGKTRLTAKQFSSRGSIVELDVSQPGQLNVVGRSATVLRSDLVLTAVDGGSLIVNPSKD
ncbi:MAG: PhzF family phenazine biosynthesis protein [Deltaproteobacteria bacterium]|jgi:predicted PhzF superfamily epimerase YddE/YHI9|nr:PhzF family phenazine biosynthesis protein [Deltaproteobacteria bacterium]